MPPKNNLRVSQFHRAVHEILVAARSRISGGTCPDQVQSDINLEITRQIKTSTTLWIVFLVCSIFASQANTGDLFIIRLGLAEIKLPVIYIAFIGAASFARQLPILLRTFSLVFAKSAMPYKNYARTRFSEAKMAIKGENANYDVITPLRAGHLFKPTGGIVYYSLLIAFFFMFIVLLMPLVGAYRMLWSVGAKSLHISTDIYLANPLGIATLSLLCLPIIIGILFFIPVKSKKDLNSIRWSFLHKTTRPVGLPHPQSNKWLKDKSNTP